MKKRALLFLLVLSAALLLALPAMAANYTIDAVKDAANILNNARSGDVVTIDISLGNGDSPAVTVVVKSGVKVIVKSGKTIFPKCSVTVNNGGIFEVNGEVRCKIANSGTVQGSGAVSGSISNYGTVQGTLKGTSVTNSSSGVIKGGTFSSTIYNSGTISGGTFDGTVNNFTSGTITGGSIYGEVKNEGTINGSGAYFYGNVNNTSYGKIENGNFDRSFTGTPPTVTNEGTISGGSFKADVTNKGTISGGTYKKAVTNQGNGKITGGFFYDATLGGTDSSYDGAYVTVSFDTNGGTPASISSQKILRGVKLPNAVSNPSKTGADFQGWFGPKNTTSEETKQYNLSETINYPGTSLKLTARYQSSGDYIITYDPNVPAGASLVEGTATEPQAFLINEPQLLRQNGFETDPYNVFVCWNTKADGTGINYPPEVLYTATKSITLYARWRTIDEYNTAHVYTVQFSAGEHGSGTMAPAEQLAFRSPYTLPECTFTPEPGYAFDGWKVASETFAAGDVIYMVDKRTTATAQWKKLDPCYVTFMPNGGTGSMDRQKFEIGETKKLTANAFTRTGFDFVGWTKDPNQNPPVKLYDDQQSVTRSENITLYALWKIKSYEVFFEGNGGRWGSLSPVMTAKVEHGNTIGTAKPTDPEKEHYTFEGWYEKDAEGKLKAQPFDFSTQITQEYTLYAKWEPKNYTVTFDPNGGAFDAGVQNTKQVTYNNTTTAITATPKKTGHGFDGWYEKDAEGNLKATAFAFATTPITGDITLYARYDINKYTVTFDVEGNKTKVAPQTVSHGGYATKPEGPGKDGHTFDGWYVKVNNTFADDPFAFATTAITADITLYAKYSAKQYKVTFDANGGTGTMAKQTFTYGVPQKLNANSFSRTCYSFAGWNTKSDGTGDSYTNGQQITLTKDITLYARWTPLPITVINPQDVVVQEGQSAAFTVQAEGVNLKYQWYLDMGDGFGLRVINGETKPTLSIDDVSLDWNGYQFACEVSNEATSKMSGAATLSVSPKPLPPQTGDRSNLTLWLVLCAISCAGMAALILHGRKKKA